MFKTTMKLLKLIYILIVRWISIFVLTIGDIFYKVKKQIRKEQEMVKHNKKTLQELAELAGVANANEVKPVEGTAVIDAAPSELTHASVGLFQNPLNGQYHVVEIRFNPITGEVGPIVAVKTSDKYLIAKDDFRIHAAHVTLPK